MAAQIDLKNITVQFGQNKAVNDVSLEINKGKWWQSWALQVPGSLRFYTMWQVWINPQGEVSF